MQELGEEVLATLGGVSSKLAAMKAKLQGRGTGGAARLVFLGSLDADAALAAVADGKARGRRALLLDPKGSSDVRPKCDEHAAPRAL